MAVRGAWRTSRRERWPGALIASRLEIFYASDIHGSERVFRKFLNAAAFCKVRAIVFGGDLTGKASVPFVETSPGVYQAEVDRPGDLGGSDPGRMQSHASTEEIPRGAARARSEVGLGESGPVRAKAAVSWPGWAVSWVFTPKLCAAGVKQAGIDDGSRPGITTDDFRRIAELEREVRDGVDEDRQQANDRELPRFD